MYFQTVIVPVPTANKQPFLDAAEKMSDLFAEHGATRSVECWSDDLMDGKITDFKKAVQAKDDEAVVFSWDWWPDKPTYEAAMKKLTNSEQKPQETPMPFDRQRLIYGVFETCFDTGGGAMFGYLDGMVASVPSDRREAFIDHAAKIAALFQEKGATRVVDAWGVDVPMGKLTDFHRAVQAQDGETIVVGWIEWPDKPTRDRGMAAMMQEPRMREMPVVWDGKLAIFGGFTPVHDSAKG